jgi:hypothetical protein
LIKYAYPDAQPINVEIPNLDLVAHTVPLRITNKSIKHDGMQQPQHGQHPNATAMPAMFQQFMNMMAGAMPRPGPTQWSFQSAIGLDMEAGGTPPRNALADGSAEARRASMLALGDLAPSAKKTRCEEQPRPSFQDLLKAKAIEDEDAVAPEGPAAALATCPPPPKPTLSTPGSSSEGVANTSVEDMHKKVKDAMQSRNKAKETPMMKRPAAAPVPSGKHPPLPCLKGDTNPAPFLYAGGKVYIHVGKHTFRVMKRVGDRVDIPVKWNDDVSAAWAKALNLIDDDPR